MRRKECSEMLKLTGYVESKKDRKTTRNQHSELEQMDGGKGLGQTAKRQFVKSNK